LASSRQYGNALLGVHHQEEEVRVRGMLRGRGKDRMEGDSVGRGEGK